MAGTSKKFLVPLGGGKDSIVTLELLKKEKKHIGVMVLNPRPVHKEIIKIAGIKEKVFIQREIDPKLLELNRRGFLNGHVPFTAYLSFLGVLVSNIFGYSHIAFSNEKSAEEENLIWRGRKINHQYSKSFDFEKKFRKYLVNYLSKGVSYQSRLRKLTELEIAEIFSRYPEYFAVFRSCNSGFKLGSKKQAWCGKCAKCLFSFLIFYPYLPEKELLKIFGENFLEKPELQPILKNFLSGLKPFDCVGTRSEIKKALKFYERRPNP